MNSRTTLELELPCLTEGRFASIPVLTDERLFERTGVRIAFTSRAGGVSLPPYDSLNLGSHVGDDLASVERNREILLEALGAKGAPLIVPNQVHGDVVVRVSDAAEVPDARARSQEGCDALLVEAAEVAALLCFADCMPVVIASPSGRFAVVHAGWRGVMSEIAAKALKELSSADRQAGLPGDPASFNVYLGPHIRSECFETSEEIHARFTEKFGGSCSAGYRHIDLSVAQRTSLQRAGASAERVCDAGVCTVCNAGEYFSYRAQGGVCGRHGAFAFRAL